MKILAIEEPNPLATDDDFTPHLAAEATRAWELHQSGIIRELYFRADREEAYWSWSAEPSKTPKPRFPHCLWWPKA